MTIEVLQAEKDIYTFVQFLYESGYSLSHRDGDMRKIVLTQSDAINSLVFDLYTSGGTYYIGDSFCSNLIAFDSCGMQSHPSTVDTQGRFAGKIAIISAEKEQATPLFNRIRRYIKNNYVYKQYNHCANMRCFFAPAYIELEEKLHQANLPKTICRGFLHLRCHESDKTYFDEKVNQALSGCSGIFLEPNSRNWKTYWANNNFIEANIPFKYDSLKLKREECIRIVSRIVDRTPLVDVLATKAYLHISYIPPANGLVNVGECCLITIWALPWDN